MMGDYAERDLDTGKIVGRCASPDRVGRWGWERTCETCDREILGTRPRYAHIEGEPELRMTYKGRHCPECWDKIEEGLK